MSVRYTIPAHVAALLAWRGRVVARTPANVCALLRFLPWTRSLRWDVDRRRIAVIGSIPWQRDFRGWNDIDDAAVQRRLNEAFGTSFGVSTVRHGIELYAQLHPHADCAATEAA